MNYKVLLVALLACCCLGVGCVGRSFDDGGADAGSEPEKGIAVPALSISETAPVTDATALSSQIGQTLSRLLATRSLRARAARRGSVAPELAWPIPSGTASLAVQLPNFDSALISLTPSLSPVLQSYASGFRLETVPDIQAFMTTYGLSSATLQVLIRQAKAVTVNLGDLSIAQAASNPLLQAALREAVPVVFENHDTLTDLANGWSQGVSAAAAARMGQVLGVGVESQIAIAVPATDSATTELILLGASALSRCTEVSSAWANGSPADPDGETPDAQSATVSAALAPVPATVSSAVAELDSGIRFATIVNDRNFSTGIPASGELPANEFVSLRLYPANSEDWSPHTYQRCTNAVVYHVQLRYVPALNKKFLRIFTERGFSMIGGMTWDGRKDRGYFQYANDIRIEPVNGNDDYSAPSWLSLDQAQPDSMSIPVDSDAGLTIRSTTNLGNGQYLRDSAHHGVGYQGMKIARFRGAIRGKWSFRMHLVAEPMRVSPKVFDWELDGPSTRIWYERATKGLHFKSVENWKDMFVVESGMPDTIAAPPRWATGEFNPQCQVVFSTTGDQTGSCRFKLTNIQRVRDVWRTAWRGSTEDTFHHAEAESGKFRHVTVDFSAVHPAAN